MLITTGIGSLPFESASEAVAYSLLHDVPFLPEIPKDIDMFQLIEKGKAASLDIFKEKIKNLKVRTIKVQCTGPVSLMLYRGYKKEDAIKLVEDYLKNTLADLREFKKLIFLDEPGVAKYGPGAVAIWERIFKNFDAVRCVHDCGEGSLDFLLENDIVEVISYDASKYDVTSSPQNNSYRNRKVIAWGIQKYCDIKDFIDGDLITSPCGFMNFKLEDCYSFQSKISRIKLQLEARKPTLVNLL